ncbi:MAG: radical SAM protein [bacterium]|nr:radical SAM protein [bacterium]
MEKIKITFVYPDFENLGVEYLMAVCLEDGHEVDFVYYQAEDPYLGRKAKTISFQQIAKKIAKAQPHIVAFSCVTDNYQYQLLCARTLKEIMPEVITIFGGVHPTAVPEKVLRNTEVDCVAIGEAEKSLSDFLREGKKDDMFILPENPIEGIVFKKQDKLVGKFKEGPFVDLNELPFPYKTPFFLSLKDSSHEYRIITSRGCPYSCSYCFNSYLHKLREKNFIRQRKVDNVIDELIWAKVHYSPKYILFVDDSFTTNMEWIFEFCNRYKKEIGLPFGCIANPYYINRKIAAALSSAGCINMQIGIQSLSEELCSKILRRKSNNDRIAESIKDLKEVGIMVQVDHMLGIPDDTLKLQEESALFYNKYRPNLISIFWLTYYPKTSIVEIAKQKGILTKNNISNVEEGKRLIEGSYLAGGSMSNPKPYYSISLLFNWLPILPRWLINFLVHSRLYRIFRIKNYFISTALPRVIQSIFNQKDFRGRSHIIRFIDKTFLQNSKDR